MRPPRRPPQADGPKPVSSPSRPQGRFGERPAPRGPRPEGADSDRGPDERRPARERTSSFAKGPRRPGGESPEGERPRSAGSFAGRGPRRPDGTESPESERPRGAGSFASRGPRRPEGTESPQGERSRGAGSFASRGPRRTEITDSPQGERPRGTGSFASRGPRRSEGFDSGQGERPRPERAPARGFAARTSQPNPHRPADAEPDEVEKPRNEREFFKRRPGMDLRGTEPRRGAAAAAEPAIPVPPGSYWLYGQHAVAAALANPQRRGRRILMTEDAETALSEVVPGPWRVQAERVERSRFQTFLPEDSVHQGIAMLVDPLQPVGIEDAIAAHPGPVLLLDQVTDPRNVGAILRSAAAFGAAAVVVQDRNAPPETASMARAASGALEIVPMVREVNIARTIAILQKAGFWVMGLDGSAKTTLAKATPRDRRVALVLGAEDTGMRRLQRETVDELVKLPIAARMESLNVSAAAAAALYELVRDNEPG